MLVVVGFDGVGEAVDRRLRRRRGAFAGKAGGADDVRVAGGVASVLALTPALSPARAW